MTQTLSIESSACQACSDFETESFFFRLNFILVTSSSSHHDIIISSWIITLSSWNSCMLWQVLVYEPEQRCHACSILEAVASTCTADTKCAILGRMALLALLVINQRHTEMSQYHPRSIFFLAQDNFSPWCYQQPTYLCEQVPCHLWPRYTHTQKYQWQFVTSYDTLE